MAILAAVPGQASAQDAPAAASDTAVDEIVVTGTRITAPDLAVAAPVTAVTADDIAATGKTSLTDVLVKVPALTNSITSMRTSGPRAAAGGVGVNLLDLRNLGTQRTLVLVDGIRHVAALPGSQGVDINTIPQALLERVDVLTGGVSAIYGADGVSGVVNFVLKRDFQGLDFRAQNGISSRGDAAERYVSLTAGTNFANGDGNIALSYEYRHSDRLDASARSIGTPAGFYAMAQNLSGSVPTQVPYNNLHYAVLSPLGGIDVNFDGRPDFTGTGQKYNLGTLIPNSGGLAQGGDGVPVAGFSGDYQPEVTTHNVNLLFSREFSPAFRLFAQGKYVSTTSYTEGQPPIDGGTMLMADNPYIPASVLPSINPFMPAVLVFRAQYDLGRATQYSDRQTWRGVIGADGEISAHARYKVAYTYGRTDNKFDFGNARIADRYYAAIDAVAGPNGTTCRTNLMPSAPSLFPNYPVKPVTFTPGPNSGCQPLNILGSNVASDAAKAFVLTTLHNKAMVDQHDVTASVTGDFGKLLMLPGGPVAYAVGGEYRAERSSLTPDAMLQQGLMLDYAPISPSAGSFDVWEAFAEVQAPILRDVPGAKLLQVGGAIRYSDYSTIGSTTTWKFDGTYAPVSDLRFHGSYSSSVRAPNISELYGSTSGFAASIYDPCDKAFVAGGSQYRATNCAAVLNGYGVDPATFNPSSNPYSGFVMGTSKNNPALKPETAKTWTAGLVLTPSFAPGLTASFDWYDIRLKNAINTPTAQDELNLCVDQPTLDNPFCGNVVRNPATGQIATVTVSPANVSRYRTSGADFAVSYVLEPRADIGTFGFRLNGGYLDKLILVATPGAPDTDKRQTKFAPVWTGNFDLSWTRGAVSANWGVNYIGKARRYTPEQVAADPTIAAPEYLYFPASWTHDLQVSVKAYDDRVTFYGGVNNLFDEKPALSETLYPVSAVGRFLYIGIRARLKDL